MSEYIKQAESFLTKTKTTLEIKKAVPQKEPLWNKKGKEHGIHYSITLENSNGKYVFDFWDSINNKEKGKRPNDYDVLACLDLLYDDNFQDFCDSFGYSNDSRLAEKTYNAVKKQDEELRKLFNEKELEELQAIQ